MLPLFSDGDRLVIWHSKHPQQGDVIVFHDTRSIDSTFAASPAPYRTYLKRVAALPGTTVQCWNSPYPLSDAEYYVLGDNAAQSTDSRMFGPIARDRIVGIVILKYFPHIRWVKPLHTLFRHAL